MGTLRVLAAGIGLATLWPWPASGQAGGREETWPRVPEAPPAFTLRYRATKRDVGGRASGERMLEYERLKYGYMVSEGKATRKQAEEVLAQMAADAARRPRPPESFEVSVAARDGKLLYTREQSGRRDHVLYDGKRTYALSSRNSLLHITGRFDFVEMEDFPIPGLSLPYVPVVSGPPAEIGGSGASIKAVFRSPLVNVSGADGISYARSVAESEGGGAPTLRRLTISTRPNAPTQSWEFGARQALGDVTVAGQMRLTQYEPKSFVWRGRPSPSVPATVTDFTLISATTTPPDLAAFDPRAWLKRGTDVQDDRGGSPVVFRYKDQAGSLEELLSLARRHELPVSGGGLRAMVSGIFVGAALLCGAAALWWARRRRPGAHVRK